MAGRDFNPDEVLSVPAQVDKLIVQATSLENLCQCFSGWYVSLHIEVRSEGLIRVLAGVRSGDLLMGLWTVACFRDICTFFERSA